MLRLVGLYVSDSVPLSVLQTPMKKTKALIGEAGATFVNAVSTLA